MSVCSSCSGLKEPFPAIPPEPVKRKVAGLILSSAYKVAVVRRDDGTYDVYVYICAEGILYLMHVVNMRSGETAHAFTTIQPLETYPLEQRWKVYVNLEKLEGTNSFTLFLIEKMDYHMSDGSIAWEVTSPPTQYTALIRLGMLVEASQFFGAYV